MIFRGFFNVTFTDDVKTYYLTRGYMVFKGIRPVC